jgi:hypothetical protein
MPTQLFQDKSTGHVTCVKKTEFNAKNKAFYMTIFICLHRPKKGLVFHETLQTNLDCGHVNVNVKKKLSN